MTAPAPRHSRPTPSSHLVSLRRHANSCGEAVHSVSVAVTQTDLLELRYHITGDINSLKIPELHHQQRRDELWRHTCAEAFIVANGSSHYFEYNFSPSSQWAAYEFDGYRQGMRQLSCDAPVIHLSVDSRELNLIARLSLPQRLFPQSLQLGLSMVIEDCEGQHSYWALRHDMDRPDFHRRENWLFSLDNFLSITQS